MTEFKNFLQPKSIALIGASNHKQKVGAVLMEKLLKFSGKIIPVNPKHEEIFGIKCYKSILDYEKGIDLAIIAIPAEFVAAVLGECGKKNIKDIIIITAGFSEKGNLKGEKKLLKIAKKHKMRLLGPNCFGICSPHSGLDTTFAMQTPKKGEIAFISQSGALWSYISDFSLDKGFGFSGFASLGNMADLSFSDFIEYFSNDKNTKAIVLYVEKLKDGRRFIETCKKCRKQIYAVKSGISKKGSEAAFSHTGSLATDYAVYQGAFRQAGVILCSSLEESFEKATGKKLIKETKKIPANLGKEVAIVTNAGGAGALVADYCSDAGINVVRGPVDVLGTALADDYVNALRNLGKDGYSIIAVLTPQKMSETEKTAEALVDFKNKSENKKKIVACFLGGKSVKKSSEFLEKNSILCFNNLEDFRRSLR